MNIVKRKANAKKPRVHSEAQLSGLRTSTSMRRQATVERLRTAIETLHAKKQAVTVQSVYEESGLRYAAIYRNPEALELFREHSAYLQEQKQRTRHKQKAPNVSPLPRDPLLHYKKPQLVVRLRAVQKQLQAVEQQQSNLAATCLERDARIAELEVKLAELEPYRAFVEQVRSRVRQEEYGDNFPPTQM